MLFMVQDNRRSLQSPSLKSAINPAKMIVENETFVSDHVNSGPLSPNFGVCTQAGPPASWTLPA